MNFLETLLIQLGIITFVFGFIWITMHVYFWYDTRKWEKKVLRQMAANMELLEEKMTEMRKRHG